MLLLLLAAAREPQSVWHQARRLLVRRCSRLVVLGRVLLLAPLLAMGFAVSARRTTLPPRQEPVLP
ncbi:MAG: hypothetical protein NTW51_01120 [Cyanobacteria bacterium]|nr:hypothetical protein [Cyanobacteriota bacterium]